MTCPATAHVLSLVHAAPGLLRAALRERVGVSWARLDALCDRAGVRCHLGRLYPPGVLPPGAPRLSPRLVAGVPLGGER